jgi:DedD protein
VNEILKQRLVGALILIALGVVFWPIIFVEPGAGISADERSAPERPIVNTEPIAAPQKKALRESAELTARIEAQRDEEGREAVAAKKTPQPQAVPKTVDPMKADPPVAPTPPPASRAKASRTRTVAPQKPVLDSQGVPIAWILQIASVSDTQKAETLRRRLLEMGHKAYTKKVYRQGKLLLRVYIGPKFERAPLDKIKAGVDGEFGVQSLVVRYIP